MTAGELAAVGVRDTPMVRQVIDAFFESSAYIWASPPSLGAAIDLSGITYVTGPSGDGKSSILRAVQQRLPQYRPLPELPTGIPLVDMVRGELGSRIALLAKFGLGDAQVVIRDSDWLSEGQKFRAQLALAFASGLTHLVVDEFLSGVDRLTAKVTARNVQRLCRRAGVRLIVATAHDDLVDSLDPDVLVRVHTNAKPEVVRRTAPRMWELDPRITVTRGTIADYYALQRFHYYPELDFNPDSRAHVVIAARFGDEPVGARLYCAPYPRSWAARVPAFDQLNAALTLGQRLVVHPRFRGIGLARRITRAAYAPRRFVYTRSVMSMFTDMHSAFGYRSHQPQTNELVEADSSLPADVRATRVLVAEFLDYASVVGLTVARESLVSVAKWFHGHLKHLDADQLAASGRVTRMGGYVLDCGPNHVPYSSALCSGEEVIGA